MKIAIIIISTSFFLAACGHSPPNKSVKVSEKSSQSYEIQVWIEEKEEPIFTSLEDELALQKKGFFNGPCGWTKTRKIQNLYPPDHPKKISGTDELFEFDEEGKIIGKWSLPANEVLHAVSQNKIFIPWENEKSLSIDSNLSLIHI